ncbi:nucleotidyltransferase family protein [Solibacillus sp. CAU 1738]|uniref:nucleotidyltransferase family protein n=1 Tax=Solibacillus sp. CAU 1738 TaxID=3140363 RepID=UPI003261A63E
MNTKEQELIQIIQNDNWMMEILTTVERLQLNDCWVCAGFIRNKVWDVVHHFRTSTPLNDIDVIYFDLQDITVNQERIIEKRLLEMMPNEPWSVKNQARMHVKNKTNPYISSYDGVAHFPEMPTAIGARKVKGEIEILAPYGTDIVFSKIVKPTPFYDINTSLYSKYVERVNNKKWDTIWTDLIIQM